MEQSARALESLKSQLNAPPVESFATTATAPRTSAAPSPRPQIPQDFHAPHILPVSPTSTVSRGSSPERSSLPKHGSPPERSSPPSSISSPPVPFRIAYPLLPSMDPRELTCFHKGAKIALDNVLNDYLGNPDMNLLEVIADLEDKRPVVGVVREDWERRCMVEGARWAGEAVGAWWEEWFGDDKLGDEGGNESMQEVALRTMDKVGKGDELGQDGDSTMIDGELEQLEAEKVMYGHDLGSTGLDDAKLTQQEATEIVDKGGQAGGSAVNQMPVVEHIISPTDKVGDTNDMVNIADNTVGTKDVTQSDGEERPRDAKEARVVACMVILLGRWIELQIEHASKSGQGQTWL